MSLTGNHIERALRAAGAGTSGLVASPAKIADLFNDAMLKYGDGKFTTAARVAALVSECMVESAWFRTTEEYPNRYQGPYKPYIGRGFIQCTWRSNYASFGKWCKAKRLLRDADYFVNHPNQLADLKWAALTAVWYFTHVRFDGKPLVEYANNIRHVGRAVNNGNPYSSSPARNEAERAAAYRIVRSLGRGIVPKAPPKPVPDSPGTQDKVITQHTDVFPTAGKIQTPFGRWGPYWSTNRGKNRKHPTWGQHTGDDWHRSAGAKEKGDPIYAVAAGRVIYAGDGRGGLGWGTSFGNQVLITWSARLKGEKFHRTSLDAHMTRVAVKYGDIVRPGDVIGYKGATGNVSGYHDHHEQHAGQGWGDRKLRPVYPGITTTKTIEIGQEFDNMEKQPTKRRKRNQVVKPTRNGKPAVLRLEDSGDVTWSFGPGRYVVVLWIRFKGVNANDELLIRSMQQDTHRKGGRKAGKPRYGYTEGRVGGDGKSFRKVVLLLDVDKPKAGLTRRNRIALENYSGKDITILETITEVWAG